MNPEAEIQVYPLKAATFDVIDLTQQLQDQTRLKNWDWTVASVGMMTLAIPYGEISGLPLLLRLFGTAAVIVGSVAIGLKREQDIAYIKGQIKGIERQALRTSILDAQNQI